MQIDKIIVDVDVDVDVDVEVRQLGSLPEVLVIEDVSLPVILERSNRKTLAIQVTDTMQLMVKSPFRISEREICHFLTQKTFWIYKQAKRIQEDNKSKVQHSEEEIHKLREQARVILTDKSDDYAKRLGVSFCKIRIGNQRTRWGSCSSKGTISYNWRLILMPEWIMDYVVVHELCHLVEMNHSKRFWQLVGSILPNYEECREWLKKNGNRY